MSDERIHRILGLTEEEYAETLDWNRLMNDGGTPVSLEPRYHSHPVLGIDGHAHGPTVEAARTPHTHRPEVQWDFEPVSLTKEQ